ncbi:hypothetical protein [Candidimonas nitroreducens]|uniref:hypothetical protein n=1 Tax=Candidimonas nitroreducens TaxID=683354 RepID=UPI001178B928|nr:hypothetical protein [Candidimonas nitroreducens]
MKTFVMNSAPRWAQSSRLGQRIMRYRFWIGIALGAAIALVSSGSLSSLAATGVGAILLSVLPCALMMGVCMKMMGHSSSSCSSENKASQQPAESVQATPVAAPDDPSEPSATDNQAIASRAL